MSSFENTASFCKYSNTSTSRIRLYQSLSKYLFNLRYYLFRAPCDPEIETAESSLKLECPIIDTTSAEDEEVNQSDQTVQNKPSEFTVPIITQTEDVKTKPVEALKKYILKEKPSVKLWEILSEDEIQKLTRIKNVQKRQCFIQRKLTNVYGIPKVLLSIFIHSITKFARKNNFDVRKTSALITIFCRTHQYFLYNSWVTPEELYAFYKEYLFYHNCDLAPVRIKDFTIYECKIITEYFCKIYLRNMPLIKLLMLPNFGLVLKYEDPPKEDGPIESPKKGKKKK